MNDEPFYIGYERRAPAPVARHVARWILITAIFLIATSALVAVLQSPVETGTFEYGVLRPFEGILYSEPVPLLHVTRETRNPGYPAVASFLLVGVGKRGIPKEALAADGQRVMFRGTLIHRENMTMVEMTEPASFMPLGPATVNEVEPRVRSLGPIEIVGELVDTKCFFGVMRPATGKVHRACAINCLRGGVPPGVLVRDTNGNGTVFMLAGHDDEPLKYDYEWAALDVRAVGDLELHDGVPILRVLHLELVDPNTLSDNL